ncbi:MAG TPA: SRPBCC family protein [Puia sp.]|nr:SRPBCC family protein [Puia sp.]
MRYIKFFVISLISIFLVLTALSMLFPSHLRVSRVVNVAAPRDKVLAAVADLRAWPQWNEFIRHTPLTNKTWSGPSAGAGAKFTSDQMTITETAADSDGITLEWDLKGGRKYGGGIAVGWVNPDSLTVQWWFELNFRWYPWEKLGVFVYDRKLGPVMEESLDSLQRYVEKSR